MKSLQVDIVDDHLLDVDNHYIEGKSNGESYFQSMPSKKQHAKHISDLSKLILTEDIIKEELEKNNMVPFQRDSQGKSSALEQRNSLLNSDNHSAAVSARHAHQSQTSASLIMFDARDPLAASGASHF